MNYRERGGFEPEHEKPDAEKEVVELRAQVTELQKRVARLESQFLARPASMRIFEDRQDFTPPSQMNMSYEFAERMTIKSAQENLQAIIELRGGNTELDIIAQRDVAEAIFSRFPKLKPTYEQKVKEALDTAEQKRWESSQKLQNLNKINENPLTDTIQ